MEVAHSPDAKPTVVACRDQWDESDNEQDRSRSSAERTASGGVEMDSSSLVNPKGTLDNV